MWTSPIASSPREAEAASSSAATASLRAWSSSDVQGRLAWTWPRLAGSSVHAHWCRDRARRSISRRRRLAPLSYDARCAALLAPTMAPIILLWLGVGWLVTCLPCACRGRRGPWLRLSDLPVQRLVTSLGGCPRPGGASIRYAAGIPHDGAARRVSQSLLVTAGLQTMPPPLAFLLGLWRLWLESVYLHSSPACPEATRVIVGRAATNTSF